MTTSKKAKKQQPVKKPSKHALVKIRRIRESLRKDCLEEARFERSRNLRDKDSWLQFFDRAQGVINSHPEGLMSERMAEPLAKHFEALFREQSYNRAFLSRVILLGLGKLVRIGRCSKRLKERRDATRVIARVAYMATHALKTHPHASDIQAYAATLPKFPVLLSLNPTMKATQKDGEEFLKSIGHGTKLKYRRDPYTKEVDDKFRVLAHELIETARMQLGIPFCKKYAEKFATVAIKVFKEVGGDRSASLLRLAAMRHPSRKTAGVRRQTLISIVKRTVLKMAPLHPSEDGWKAREDSCQF